MNIDKIASISQKMGLLLVMLLRLNHFEKGLPHRHRKRLGTKLGTAKMRGLEKWELSL